jgi:hypothetical protein
MQSRRAANLTPRVLAAIKGLSHNPSRRPYTRVVRSTALLQGATAGRHAWPPWFLAAPSRGADGAVRLQCGLRCDHDVVRTQAA